MISGSNNNTIGGTTTTFRNIISGNTGPGVSIGGSTSTGNILQGNLIGTDVSGGVAIPNSSGVVISAAANNTVGGAIVASRNIISGNTNVGVLVTGSGASGNSIQGNYIGLTQSGSAALRNTVGVQLAAGASSNTVGGTATGNRNIISGNANVQIFILGSTNNAVLGNTLGLDSTGATSLGGSQAAYAGLAIQDGSTGNTIGGITATASNVISGSAGPGLAIIGQSQTGVGTAAGNNLVQGNFIGTDLAGVTRQANAGGGVVLNNGTINNSIGGTVGGLARNVISGNTGAGVAIFGQATTGNLIQANSIGTQADNVTLLGNTADGIYVDAAVNNQIGGSLAAAANTIAGNDGAGVFVNSGTRIAIRRNSIFSNDLLGIDLAPRGVNPNTTNPGVGPNNLQNYPVISTAVTTGTTPATVLTGKLTSAPSRTFTVDFFSNTVQDLTGNGQAATFIGTTSVTTDATGVASFNFPTTTAVALNAFISATATDPDGNTSELAFNAINVAPSVDLVLSLTDAPDPVAVGGVVTYTIKVGNNGPSNATNVVVTNTLPAGVSFIGATSSQGTIGQTGSTVTGTVGSLLLGQTATITITVVAPTAGTITNTATVTLTEADSNQANNTASVQTVVTQGVDIIVTTLANPSPASVGAPVSITFTVTNASTVNTATDLVLSAPLPAGATVVSSSSTQGATSTGNTTLLAAIGSLAPGATAKVTLVLNPTATGTLTTVATVSGKLPDVNPATNTAAAIVTVTAAIPPIVSDGPRVLALDRTGYRQQPTNYILTFDGPLEVASATASSNYILMRAGADNKIGTSDDVRIPFQTPFYNATGNTVSIRTRRQVSLHQRILLAVSGTAPNGVKGTNGQLIDGENTGSPGSNFVRRFKGVGPGRILLN